MTLLLLTTGGSSCVSFAAESWAPLAVSASSSGQPGVAGAASTEQDRGTTSLQDDTRTVLGLLARSVSSPSSSQQSRERNSSVSSPSELGGECQDCFILQSQNYRNSVL